MVNQCIVTRLRAMLLLCIGFFTNPALWAATPASQVLPQVEAAARKHVERMAAGSGLLEPEFTLEVAPGTRPLSACKQAMTVEAVDTRLVARMRFAAVCAGGEGWRYEFLVRAQLSARVAVMAVDVPAGKVLQDEDVLLERHEVANVAEVVADPAAIAGMSAKRALHSGEVLRMTLLSSPVLVKRGDAVTIVARREQIEVSMAGEALDSGAKGSVVRVRNAVGNTIRARVTGPATVEPMDMPASTQSPD